MHDVLVELLPAFDKKKAALCTSKLDFSVRKKAVNCYTWSIALCAAET